MKGRIFMKKLSLILAFILALSPLLISCTEVKENAPGSTGKKEEQKFEYTLSELPELDFGQKEFGIYGVNGSMSYMIAEEETGDLVNDAVFQRNIAIEEAYNLRFNMFEAERGEENNATKIRTFIMSGDTTYHLYQALQHGGMPALILRDFFIDWNTLEHINADRPYWNSKGTKNIGFYGRLYATGGDINLVTYNSTNCILFNKKLFDDLGIDYPYEDVYNKTWTADKMIEIVKQGYADLNGDTVWDTQFDRLGFSGWGWEMLYAAYMGLGGKTLIQNEDGAPELAMANEKHVEIIDKLIELYDGVNTWVNMTTYTDDKKMFTDGRLLMDDNFITGISQNRDSEFDIGVVPYPMLDEAQGEYYSRAANIAHLSYIPTTNAQLEETGIILEAMAIESYNNVRPTYYDITLDLKEAADEETRDMVDIILASSTYLYEGFMNINKLAEFVDKRTNTYSSWCAAMQKQFDLNLSKIEKYYMS